MKPVKPEWHNEDKIEASMRLWLERHGWKVDVRASQFGVDISALDPNERTWMFEVKGYPSTFQKRDGIEKSRNTISTQRQVWLVESVGQIVLRMKSPNIRYGLVYPDHPTDQYFEKRTLELSQFVREKLDLWIMLVAETGNVKVLAPQNNRFMDWSNVIS